MTPATSVNITLSSTTDAASPHMLILPAPYFVANTYLNFTLNGGSLSGSTGGLTVVSSTNRLVTGAQYDIKLAYVDSVSGLMAEITHSNITFGKLFGIDVYFPSFI